MGEQQRRMASQWIYLRMVAMCQMRKQSKAIAYQQCPAQTLDRASHTLRSFGER